MTSERTEEQAKEIWDILRETAQSARETDRRMQETDKRMQETDKRMQETDKRIRDLDKQIADLTGSWSKFVESMVEPSVVRLFKERGIEMEGTQQRVKRRRNGKEIEIDILGINKEWVVAVEVKTTLKVEDVNEHIERLDRFRNFFPEYTDRKVIGAVAGMRMEEEADKYAYRRGFFVLAQSGENVIILNDEKFRPKLW